MYFLCISSCALVLLEYIVFIVTKGGGGPVDRRIVIVLLGMEQKMGVMVYNSKEKVA